MDLCILNDFNNLPILIVSILVDVNKMCVEYYLFFSPFSLVCKKKEGIDLVILYEREKFP